MMSLFVGLLSIATNTKINNMKKLEKIKIFFYGFVVGGLIVSAISTAIVREAKEKIESPDIYLKEDTLANGSYNSESINNY